MQLKEAKRRELTKIGQEPGINYTRWGMLWTPVSPPPLSPLIKSFTLLLRQLDYEAELYSTRRC